MNPFSFLMRLVQRFTGVKPAPLPAPGITSSDEPVEELAIVPAIAIPTIPASREAAIVFSYRTGCCVASAVWCDADGVGHREFIAPGSSATVVHGVLLDAFEHVLTLPDLESGRTRLYVAHRPTRAAILPFAASFPTVELTMTGHHVQGALLKKARTLAQTVAIGPCHAKFATVPDQTLTVATDASVGRQRRGIGIAFVTEDGQFGQGYIASSGNIHDGELRAIELALTSLPGRLRILSDSQTAVGWLTDPVAAPSEARRRRAERIAAQMRSRHCQLLWVKGTTAMT